MTVKETVAIDYTQGEGLERVDFKGSVTLKELDYGEWNAYQEGIMDVKAAGRASSVSVSVARTSELAIIKARVSDTMQKITYIEDKPTKAFLPVVNNYPLDNMTNIQRLPRKLGDLLMVAFTRLNEVSEKNTEGQKPS